MNTTTLHISNGNTKMGAIPNLSFPPGVTCRKDAPCLKDGCYALKFYKMFPTCKNAWNENLEFYKEDPIGFWDALDQVFKRSRAFRYFVSGDIPDPSFFAMMIHEAYKNQHCEFLCFTKQYEYVNEVMDGLDDKELPKNLHILFSAWEGLVPINPYGFPTTEVITEGMEVPREWKICGGNCTECVCQGIGCWEVGPGEVIAFYKH